ncbi:MAG: cyclase family protein [Planctomycetia bacterium]|nr:cyclase family protein [Planctomycetia bacterium]
MFVDLTRKIESGMPVYPGDPLFQSRIVADHSFDGFRCSCWTIGSHLGTHIDSPFHQFIDGEIFDDLSLDFFAGKAAVIDLSQDIDIFYRKNIQKSFHIEPELLEPFEKIFENVSRILIRTGWDRYWKSSDFYRLFPSFLPETAEWIADFPIKLLGLETPSLAALSIDVSVDSLSVDSPLKEEVKDRSKRLQLKLNHLKNNSLNFGLNEDESPKIETNDKRNKKCNIETNDSQVDKYLAKPKDLDLNLSAERALSDETTRIADFCEETINEVQLHADQECHRILLGRRPPILLLEGLVHLEQLPAFKLSNGIEKKASDCQNVISFDESKTFVLYCFPLNIENADGCPVRAVAEIK